VPATRVRTTTVGIVLAAALAAGLVALPPATADTKADLERAKAELAEIQSELRDATYAWNVAMTRLDQTRADIALTRQRIGDLQRRLDRIQRRLERRAVLAYTVGPANVIDALMSASSFSEFSDRLEFLGSMTQSDVDLSLEQALAQEQLRREREDLAALSERQVATARQLDAVRDRIDERFLALQQRVSDLTADYRKELAARRALVLIGQTPNTGPIGTGSALQVCPVAGPNSFVDSFGWPRVGHTHQGIDLIAPFGTPIVAAHAGTVSHSSSSSGGLQAYVRAPSGTYTFYAHLSSFSSASGSVGAGTVIGYVGSTGNAGSTNHLHFEYHPGGGAAVNPYQILLAVC
jgi:murein DD-endopeptidase MepM/ murein hydrolase activator NlpD